MHDDEISILLCSYNGERYIREQIDSILNQSHPHWTLYISDDGSTDKTLEIIREYQNSLPVGKIILQRGPGQGFAANFLSLMKNITLRSPYYAFSDQDDIWCKDKLRRALELVHEQERKATSPFILYGSRTTLVDQHVKTIGLSPLFSRGFQLRNALIQSYAGGNTMLFNLELKLLVEKLPDSIKIISHDWFLYILCSLVNGAVIYDSESNILYRQHDENLVGSNTGIMSKVHRLKELWQGCFAEWNEQNRLAIDFYSSYITPKNVEIINDYYSCGCRSAVKRLRFFLRSGVYRHNKTETVCFALIVLFNRLIKA